MKKKIYKVVEITNRGKHIHFKSTIFNDCWNFYLDMSDNPNFKNISVE